VLDEFQVIQVRDLSIIGTGNIHALSQKIFMTDKSMLDIPLPNDHRYAARGLQLCNLHDDFLHCLASLQK
jgi:hypothetical protein